MASVSRVVRKPEPSSHRLQAFVARPEAAGCKLRCRQQMDINVADAQTKERVSFDEMQRFVICRYGHTRQRLQ